jgi:hypothetical protein
MTTRNLTTYTEVDTAGNRLQNIVSSDYDFVNVPRNEEILLYKDMGAGFISGDFSHLFDFQADSASNRGFNIVNGWANIIGNRKDITNAFEDALLFSVNQSGTGLKSLTIQEIDGGALYPDSFFSWVPNTRYYTIFERVGALFTSKIYTDSDRTILADTLSLSLHDIVDFRYHYAAMSLNDGVGGAVVSGNAGNYDFQLIGIVEGSHIAFSIFDKQFNAFKELSGKNTII